MTASGKSLDGRSRTDQGAACHAVLGSVEETGRTLRDHDFADVTLRELSAEALGKLGVKPPEFDRPRPSGKECGHLGSE